MRKNMLGLALGTVAVAVGASQAAPIGTAFTYQGYLENPPGTPIDDTCDFEFSLWDDGDPAMPENQIGMTQAVSGVVVSGGVFTIGPPDVDFGAGAFGGDARWLEIHVKCPPDVGFTTLLPRVELAPTPHAVRAVSGVGGPDALNVTSGGSVGIGTDTPAAETRLHVQAGSDGIGVLADVAGAPGGRIGLRTSSVGYAELVKNAYFDFGDLSWKRFDTGTGAFALECQPGGDVMLEVAEAAANPITWANAITLKAADGSVGVGTDTPEAPLHVQEGSAGAVTADARSVVIVERNDHAYLSLLTPSNTERGILFGDENNNASGAIIYNPENVLNPNSMQFRTGGGIPQMVIDDNGDVGIGTIGPDLDTRLHVRARSDDFGVLVDADGTSGSEIGLHTANTGYASLVKNAYYDEAGATGWNRFHSAMGAFLGEVAPNGDTKFRVAGTGLGTIAWKDAITLQSSSGNVGIGTTAPAAALHVKYAGGNAIVSEGDGTGDARIEIGNNFAGHHVLFDDLNDSHALKIESASTRDLAFNTSGANERMRIKSAGNVGIGISAPTARLHVVETGTSQSAIEGVGGFVGVQGSVNAAGSGVYYGITGDVSGGSGQNFGVSGSASNGTQNFAVYGEALGSVGTKYGIYGTTSGSGTNYAGYFVGNVQVVGTLSKSTGSFKIDHPLDPANKYLYHSFVESPDMMNIYDGIAVLDTDGTVWVQMPEWFEALNRDFRYQLTCIGAFAPVYISQEIADNRFQIAGGKPGMKVSWTVTGIRHDAYADAHRIPVEEMKSTIDRGKYLHPKEFGMPEEAAIGYIPPEARLGADLRDASYARRPLNATNSENRGGAQ